MNQQILNYFLTMTMMLCALTITQAQDVKETVILPPGENVANFVFLNFMKPRSNK